MTQAIVRPSIKEADLAQSKCKYLIGEGGFREVYRVPNSYWVYKFDKYSQIKVHNNSVEYKRYLDLKDTELPFGFFIPEMHMLDNGVLAAQYIKGEPAPNEECSLLEHWCDDRSLCFWEIYGYSVAELINDPHSHNIVIDPSFRIYLVDLA